MITDNELSVNTFDCFILLESLFQRRGIPSQTEIYILSYYVLMLFYIPSEEVQSNQIQLPLTLFFLVKQLPLTLEAKML